MDVRRRGNLIRHRLGRLFLLALIIPFVLGVRRIGAPDAMPRASAPPHRLEIERAYDPHGAVALSSLDIETSYRGRQSFSAEPQPEEAIARPALAVAQTELPARYVALTFDTEIPNGGEARQTLIQVLDILKQARVRATFFIVGRWAQANPDLLRRMVAEHQEVASHSFSHRPFAQRPLRELSAELSKLENLVRRETGVPLSLLFRPPYGCIGGNAAQLVRQRGYHLVGWDISGQDARSETTSALEVVAAVKRDLHPGGTILLHTNRWITAAALPEILRLLDRQGLDPVQVTQLLQRQPMLARDLSRGAQRQCGTLVAHASTPIQRASAR